MFKNLIISLRPKQWTKNLIIFAPLLFTANLFNFSLLKISFAAFFIFSILCGSLYIVNDLIDLEYDKKHPKKKLRPITSGKLQPNVAFALSLLLLCISLFLAYLLNIFFFLICFSYFILNLSYSIIFKNIVILDIIFVSFGFVLRVLSGIVVLSLKISPWIIFCTGLLSLFLVLGKRRAEVINFQSGEFSRAIIQEYSLNFIDQIISVVTSSTIIAYSLYTFTSETALKTHYLMFTIPFVIYGVLRYIYLIYQKNEGEEPETILLKDKPLILDIILWIVICGIIIYEGK